MGWPDWNIEERAAQVNLAEDLGAMDVLGDGTIRFETAVMRVTLRFLVCS